MKLLTGLFVPMLVLVGCALGCGNQDQPPAPTPAAQPVVAQPETPHDAPPQQATPAPTPPEQAPIAGNDDNEPPTEADFEEDAQTEITAENLEAQVDRLAQEIGEPPAH